MMADELRALPALLKERYCVVCQAPTHPLAIALERRRA